MFVRAFVSQSLLLFLLIISNANAKTHPYKILFLGDSFTVGTGLGEGHEQDAFPFQLTQKLKAQNRSIAQPVIYAVDGDTTKHLLGALNALEPHSNPDNQSTKKGEYDLVILSIGINDLFRGHSLEDYQHHFTELLDRAIHFAHGHQDNVIVISIPAWDASPSVADGSGPKFRAKKYAEVRKRMTEISLPIKSIHTDENGMIVLDIDDKLLQDKIHTAKMLNSQKGIAQEIDKFNQAALAAISEKNRIDTRKITFIDITSLTRQDATDKVGKPIVTYFAQDGIHYSKAMYGKWVDKILPIANEKLKD